MDDYDRILAYVYEADEDTDTLGGDIALARKICARNARNEAAEQRALAAIRLRALAYGYGGS